jgi:periplasmic protein TonB
MTNRDSLTSWQVLLLVLLWCASNLPGVAADQEPSGNGLLKGGGGTRFGSYAAQVQSGIKEALLQNNKTRTALILGVVVRIWVDRTARITRAQLVGTLGEPSLDSAITNEVLTGLQLKEPPPADMPMPIVVRVNTHRSN